MTSHGGPGAKYQKSSSYRVTHSTHTAVVSFLESVDATKLGIVRTTMVDLEFKVLKAAARQFLSNYLSELQESLVKVVLFAKR